MKGKAFFLLSLLDELIDRQEVEDKKTAITLFLARFTLDEDYRPGWRKRLLTYTKRITYVESGQ
jgi:hypothetical protein